MHPFSLVFCVPRLVAHSVVRIQIHWRMRVHISINIRMRMLVHMRILVQAPNGTGKPAQASFQGCNRFSCFTEWCSESEDEAANPLPEIIDHSKKAKDGPRVPAYLRAIKMEPSEESLGDGGVSMFWQSPTNLEREKRRAQSRVRQVSRERGEEKETSKQTEIEKPSFHKGGHVGWQARRCKSTNGRRRRTWTKWLHSPCRPNARVKQLASLLLPGSSPMVEVGASLPTARPGVIQASICPFRASMISDDSRDAGIALQPSRAAGRTIDRNARNTKLNTGSNKPRNGKTNGKARK